MSPCSDGMGRTGAFICLHAQIEKLKTEGVIDCFQFIKSARLNRPGLVQSVVSLWENASSNSACAWLRIEVPSYYVCTHSCEI